MNDLKSLLPRTAPAPVAKAEPVHPPVTHQEPAAGGSYIRNTKTGELVKSLPAPAAQPTQE